MVDLPQVPRRLTTTATPQSSLTRADIEAPYVQLTGVLDQAAKESGAAANRLATQAGLKAVSRDDAGNVVVQQAPIVGDAAIYYQHAVTLAAAADGENVARNDMIDLRQQFRNDPEAFRAAAAEYRKKKVDQYEQVAGPEVGLHLGKAVDNLVTETYRGLLNEKESHELARSKDSITYQIATKGNEAIALAESGDTSSPDFARRLHDVSALWLSMSDNPRLNVSKDHVQFEMQKLNEGINSAKFAFDIKKKLSDPTGGPEAALRAVQAALDDETIPPTQRAENYKAGLKAIQEAATNETRLATVTARARKQLDEAEENKIIIDSASDSPRISETDIKSNTRMSPEAKMRMLSWVKRDGMPEPMAQVSQITSADLFRRMNLPDGDPRRITDLAPIREAYAPSDGSRSLLKRQDMEWLQKQFLEARTPQGEALNNDRKEFFARYAASIDGALDEGGLHSALGNQKIFEMQKDAARQEEMLRSQGKDPHLLYNPQSEYFLGKPAYISKFHVSMSQALDFRKQLETVATGGNLTGAGKTITGIEVKDAPLNVTSKADYDKLKPGTEFVGADGKRYRKP